MPHLVLESLAAVVLLVLSALAITKCFENYVNILILKIWFQELYVV